MKIRRAIIKLVVALAILVAAQIATYFLFAHRQLNDELLSDGFGSLNDAYDSAYVSDFFVSGCGTDLLTYYSHDLKRNEDQVKKKLNVKYVFFRNKADFQWTDPEEDKYRLVYHTWVEYPESWITRGFFSATQVEILKVHKKYVYERSVTYRWVLFFWVKYYEQISEFDRSVQGR